jgi:hypothetical protein
MCIKDYKVGDFIVSDFFHPGHDEYVFFVAVVLSFEKLTEDLERYTMMTLTNKGTGQCGLLGDIHYWYSADKIIFESQLLTDYKI